MSFQSKYTSLQGSITRETSKLSRSSSKNYILHYLGLDSTLHLHVQLHTILATSWSNNRLREQTWNRSRGKNESKNPELDQWNSVFYTRKSASEVISSFTLALKKFSFFLKRLIFGWTSDVSNFYTEVLHAQSRNKKQITEQDNLIVKYKRTK